MILDGKTSGSTCNNKIEIGLASSSKNTLDKIKNVSFQF